MQLCNLSPGQAATLRTVTRFICALCIPLLAVSVRAEDPLSAIKKIRIGSMIRARGTDSSAKKTEATKEANRDDESASANSEKSSAEEKTDSGQESSSAKRKGSTPSKSLRAKESAKDEGEASETHSVAPILTPEEYQRIRQAKRDKSAAGTDTNSTDKASTDKASADKAAADKGSTETPAEKPASDAPQKPSEAYSSRKAGSPGVAAEDPQTRDKETAPSEKANEPPRKSYSRRTSEPARPSSFQEVTPGVSRVEDVRRIFGKPEREIRAENTATLGYKIGPFPRVDVACKEELVESVLIQLPELADPHEVINELDLANFESVLIRGDSGDAQGQIFPERGVRLKYSRTDDSKVSHVVLERIAAEPFLLRVQSDREFRYERQLADLKVARSLAPTDARIAWLEAQIYMECGRHEDALARAREAVQRDPASPKYTLLHAWLLAQTGQYVRAVKDTRDVLQREGIDPIDKAQAALQLGNTISSGPGQDSRQAMEHHQSAIQLAVALMNDPSFETRRAAKHVLLDAHLEIARDIACGNYQAKSEGIARWLANAEKIVVDLLEQEHESEAIRLHVCGKSLEALATLTANNGTADSTVTSQLTEKALEVGRRLIGDAADPLYQKKIEWELGECLFHSIRISQAAGEVNLALRLADNAVALLEMPDNSPPIGPTRQLFLGRFYAAVGTIHAVEKRDHAEAVKWYDKAQACFKDNAQLAMIAELEEHGDRLISMGISYWSTGNREMGIRLTKSGAQFVQRAVKNGSASEKALAVPYGNLATMYRELGNTDEAKSYDALAAKVEDKDTKQR